MNQRAEESMDPVDELWLGHCLEEVLAEAPPDLSARVLAADAAARASAASAVQAAASLPSRRRLLTAAMVLLGLGVLGGVVVLQGTRATTEAQDPKARDAKAEIQVADAAQLAKLLPQVGAVTLIALRDERGARLPDFPEYVGVLADREVRNGLLGSLGAAAVVGAAFGPGEAQAELVLQVGDRQVRGRLRIRSDEVTFGTAAFSLPDALPPAVARSLREEWLRRAAASPSPRRKVQVSSLRELVAAIGSDVTIEVTGGPFELAPRDDRGELPTNPAVTWGDAGEPCLRVHDVHNLYLRSLGGRVRLLGTAPGDVMTFADCRGVWCEGLVLGHKEGLQPACSAPVVTLQRCQGFVLRDCELFGCGTEGVVADHVAEVALESCEVHTCRFGVVRFTDATGLAFRGTVFRDCGIWQGGFLFRDCARVAFTDCSVSGMDSGDATGDDGSLFDARMDEPVQFARGRIVGNRCRRVATSRLLLALDGTTIEDNGPEVTPQH